MKSNRVGAVMTVIGAAVLGLVAASPTAHTQPSQQTCTEQQAAAGDCLAGYVTAGQQPEVSLVTSAVQAGRVDLARAFIDKYRSQRPPGLTAQLEAALQAALHPNGGNSGNWTTPYHWELRATEEMQVCFEECHSIGAVQISFDGSLDQVDPDALLTGSMTSQKTFDVRKLPTNSAICELKKNEKIFGFPYPDSVFGTYPTCKESEDYSSYNAFESTVSNMPSRSKLYWHIEFLLTPGQTATNQAGALIRIPKRVVYESSDFDTDGNGFGRHN